MQSPLPFQENGIFVSQSSKDNDFTERLVHDLRLEIGDREAVWWHKDPEIYKKHTEIWDIIPQEIKRRKFFLLVLSPNALESRPVDHETEIALAERSNDSSTKTIIIALYQDCQISAELQCFNAIDFTNPKNYKNALDNLLDLLQIPRGMEAQKVINPQAAASAQYSNPYNSKSSLSPTPDIEHRYHSTLEGHTDKVYDIAWSPTNQYIASASADGTVQIWNAYEGTPFMRYTGHKRRVNCVAWSPDGSQIASAGNDKVIHIWQATTGKLMKSCVGHTDWINDIAWSPDGKRLVSASDDRTVRVWNTTNSQQILCYQDHKHWVNAVDWSEDGTYIASASSDKTVQIWRSDTGEQKSVCKGHTKGVNALIWSPNDVSIASAGNDNTIRIWHARDGHPGFAFHNRGTLALARSPHGSRIASASGQLIYIWYVTEGKDVLTLPSHTNLIRSIAWSPNGKYIASVGDDKKVQIVRITDR